MHRRTTPWVAVLGLTAAVLAVIAVLGAVLSTRQSTVSGPVSVPGDAADTAYAGPGREPSGAAVLRSNPLYGLPGLPGYDCRVPAIAEDDTASMAAFMGRLTDCLDATWSAGLTSAGISFARPDRVFWDSPGRSPCGDFPASGASAFYCPVNHGMYVGTADVVKASGYAPVSDYAIYGRVLAHEYAHHVQDQAGILTYAWNHRAAASAAHANEVTRRVELQAQCLAGAYFQAVRLTLPVDEDQWEQVLDDSRSRGQDAKAVAERSHGSGASYAGWLERGFTSGAPGTCVTWTAPESDVS